MDNHFSKIFWFIVMLTIFGAGLSILCIVYPVSSKNERFADTALIFWLSTAVSGGIGYLIGSSVGKGTHPQSEGTTTANIQADITTTTSNQDEHKTN